MRALTVTHTLPAPLEVIPAGMAAESATLTSASQVPIDSADRYAAGNALLVKIHDLGSAIERRRVELKKPVTQLGKAIDECAARAADPLDAAKRSLQGRLVSWQREQQRIADEARRAAEEQARKEREAAEAERHERQKLAAEALAEELAEALAEAKEMEALIGTPVAAVVAELPPEPPVPAPVAKPVAPLPPPPAPSAVQVRRVPTVVVVDLAALLGFLVANRMTDLVQIDMRALTQRLNAGVAFPGVEMQDREVLATRTRGGAL